MTNKFKLGDLITGNDVNDENGFTKYSITNENSICKVIKLYSEHRRNEMRVEVMKCEKPEDIGSCHDVNSKYFNLVKEVRVDKNSSKKKSSGYSIIIGKKIIKRNNGG